MQEKKYLNNLLIIGGSGFVGSFLIKELKNFKVGNLDKNPSPFFGNITVNGDIRNYDEIKIPSDYRIIGTLNTADKHYLFSMSDALKRRFAYVEIPIPARNEKTIEIFYALQNAINSFENKEEFSDIVEIKTKPNIEYHVQNFEKKVVTIYDVLDLCRLFKPLGTAILKSIYQTLLVAEKLKQENALDYAIHANILPQLESINKMSLELIYKFMFENVVNYMKNDLEEENLAMYSKYFKTILEFIQLDLTKIDSEGKTTLDDIVLKIQNSELTEIGWSIINGAVKQKRVEMNIDKDNTVFKIFKKSFLALIESESMI